MPFVSVIIPAYNAERWLDDSLGSVLAQSFDDWEAVVVNDGSTDNTVEVASNYANQDKRIRVISQENGGISAARNTGIDNARGRYVFFLDADDRLPGEALAGLAEGASRNGFPEYVKGAHKVLMPDGQIVDSQFTPPVKYLKTKYLVERNL